MTNIAAFLYLVSGMLFILVLRGPSHPSTSRKGNLYGMIGMGTPFSRRCCWRGPPSSVSC